MLIDLRDSFVSLYYAGLVWYRLLGLPHCVFRRKPASFMPHVDFENWAYKAETCYSNCDEDSPQNLVR